MYKDHDLPFQNAKIIPSGYLQLEPRGQPKTRTVYNTSQVRLASADSVRVRTNLKRSCVRGSSSMPPLLASTSLIMENILNLVTSEKTS